MVEGVRVGKEAVLGANVVLTKSTKIIHVTGKDPIEMKGYVPERSVVIPGTYKKNFSGWRVSSAVRPHHWQKKSQYRLENFSQRCSQGK